MRNILIYSLAVLFVGSVRILSQWILETDLPETYGISAEYIVVVDTQTVWTVGWKNTDTSYVFNRTSYMGWNPTFYSDSFLTHEKVMCVAALDSMTAWVGTASGKVYYTNTRGDTAWTLQIIVGGEGFINDIKFSKQNINFGFVYSDPPAGAGTPFKIFKTTNKGFNWIELSPLLGGSSYLGSFKSMCMTDSDHVWIGLNCPPPTLCGIPKIAYTTNGGLNWYSRTVTNADAYFAGPISFSNDNMRGLIALWSFVPVYICQSIDGGNIWSFFHNTGSYQPVQALVHVDGTSVWYYCVSEGGHQIYKSKDNGYNWYAMSSSLPANDVFNHLDAIKYGEKIYAWAISVGGRIYRLVDTASVIGINGNQNEIPKMFVLYQNYPNPFNPSTVIKYDLPVTEFVSLKIYDAIGREVASLVNNKQEAGVHEIVWNASNVTSGVYFYKLQAGEYSSTKKMMLIK